MTEPRQPIGVHARSSLSTAQSRDLEGEDTRARTEALDVERSFLVQAPAGSGKTELLIQRFLALLASVDRPERIVAMTFTRKAAGEMRERIVAALRDAQDGKPVSSPHEARTRELAAAALRQDRACGWQLLQHPARLAVFTIDALCARLAQQAPLATRLGAAPRYEEQAEPLYLDGARAALASASPTDPRWQRLLAHLDNDAGRAVDLLASMLERRDQWLVELPRAGGESFRSRVEAVLADEIGGGLAAAAGAFPPGTARQLSEHQRYAVAHLRELPEAAEIAASLAACADAGGLPPIDLAAQRLWIVLADWLLVASGPQFRKRLNKKVGFPAKGTGNGAKDREAANANMQALLETLAEVPGLAEALDALRRLPPPRYGDDAWEFVDALLEVLPLAVEELMLTFRDNGAIDFTQAALAALDALGSEETPSDLLLRLDFALHHLLIDEFQDTSFIQVALVRRLTAGWVPGDGRTLFAVGDPMQSIYRFRGAEVRLFVEAQQDNTIAGVPVDSLVLRRNFRSHAGLVDWVNRVFPRVLGNRSDPWRGQVEFAHATVGDATKYGPAPTIELFSDPAREAAAVVAQIRAALAEGADDVAVLVRARTHLVALLPALRAAGIAFAALELDTLSQRQSVLDLQSLTHALVQPADRLAWLAVLRAPWCGLLLPELFAVTAAADSRYAGSVAALVESATVVDGLSADGVVRFERLAHALRPALAARGATPVAARVRGAWLALGGPATLEEAIDLDAAERFLALLAEHETAGDVPDWAAFVAALAKLHAEPEFDASPQVKVMTLHRAKGLQFDTVLMPGLGRPTRRTDPALLRWRRRPNGVLVAPMRARGGDDDPVHAFLGSLAKEEERAELGRLLYVGATRAMRKLHLTAVLDTEVEEEGVSPAWKAPASGSALAVLWDGVRESIAAPPVANPTLPPGSTAPRGLGRFPAEWLPLRPDRGIPVAEPVAVRAEHLAFDWARETVRHVGTVAHRVFAQIGREGLAAWTAERAAAQQGCIRAELAGEGVEASELDGAVAQVLRAIDRLLDDGRGRWLFAPTHLDARSEWALAGLEQGAIVHAFVDRTFVADGVRWIVDFKTGTHAGGDVEAFLDQEVERYRPGLERYARLVGAIDSRPIRLALYHPMLGGWREWAAMGQSDPEAA